MYVETTSTLDDAARNVRSHKIEHTQARYESRLKLDVHAGHVLLGV